MAQVHIGEYADIHLVAYPDRVLKGRISNILPILDPNIRTAKVRLEVENPGLMRLGMFVTATFHGETTEKHATVPATAILHLHDREWVYTPLGNGRFRRAGSGRREHAARQHAGGRLRDQTRRPGGIQRSGLPEHGGAVDEMIRKLVDFALNNRFLVLAAALLLFVWGAISFHQLPVEAYPDVADNYVEIITQWPGISAEQIEQQVTIPLEIVMNGIPHVTAPAVVLAVRPLRHQADLRRRSGELPGTASECWSGCRKSSSACRLPPACRRRWEPTGARSARSISSRCTAPIRRTT